MNPLKIDLTDKFGDREAILFHRRNSISLEEKAEKEVEAAKKAGHNQLDLFTNQQIKLF